MSAQDGDLLLILKDRARRLASTEENPQTAPTEPYVAFLASGQCFGVPLNHVIYAGRLRHLTPLPGGSPYLLGITVLAGHLVSVLDVAAFLNLRNKGLGDVTCCLVVQWEDREIGLSAEQLIGIEDVPIEKISPIGPSAGATRAALLGRLHMLILDLDRLLGDARLSPNGSGHG